MTKNPLAMGYGIMCMTTKQAVEDIIDSGRTSRTTAFAGVATVLRRRTFTGLIVLAAIASALMSSAAHAQYEVGADATTSAARAARIDAIIRDVSAHQHEHDDRHVGKCVALPQFSVLFDPGAHDEDVAAYLDGLSDDALGVEFEAFQAQGSIWTSTATNGAVTQGNALTLTYSFVPDGTSVPATGNGDATAPSNLIATMNASFPGGFNAFKTHVRSTFDRYQALTNITYVEVTDDGAAFPASLGLLGARGDIRIAMKPIDGSGTILAVNFFPQFGGDMIMDSGDIAMFANSNTNFIRLRNILAHEHGHGLGLRHVIPESGTKLMEPALITNFDGPQEDDIRGITHLYGDSLEANNALGSDRFIGGPLNTPASSGLQVLSVLEASLERADSKDFYGFTAFAAVPIAIRVDPIGTTYDQGPQFGTATALNAKAVRNMGLRLWRRVSAQQGTFELFAQIDFNAAGEAEYHPPIPYQLAGYMVAEVYSTDNVNDCQRYMLRISNSAIDPPVEPASMTVFDIAGIGQVDDGDSLQFGTVQVGQSANKTLTIVNGGPGSLQIGTITLQGPAAANFSFNLIGSPTVPAGQNRSLALSFSPSVAGLRQAVLTIPNNDAANSNFSVILNGTGAAAPVMQVRINNAVVANNGNFNFGDVLVGGNRSVPLQVLNTGNAQLTVTSFNFAGANAGDFSTDLTGANIAPGGAASGNLVLAPTAVGPRSASLTIVNNAAAYSAALQGNGLPDCNTNGVADGADISGGTSQDCNANGIPDECETDGDGDGTIDDCDGCPADPNKTAPGICGCGVADTDTGNFGVPDCLRTIVPGSNGAVWTLIPQTGTTLVNVEARDPAGTEPPPANVQLPAGGIAFEVHGVAPGGSTVLTVKLDVPDGMTFNSYWKFGPEPANATPHWYEFLFDGTTGATINANVVTLTLVDGGRGDHDGAANGVIVDPGGVALVTEVLAPLPPPIGGCGGGLCGVGGGAMVPFMLLGQHCMRQRRRGGKVARRESGNL